MFGIHNKRMKVLLKLQGVFLIFCLIVIVCSKPYAVKTLIKDGYTEIDFDGSNAVSKTIVYTNDKVHKVGIEHTIIKDNLQEFKTISLQHETNKPQYFMYNSNINDIICDFCSKSLSAPQKHKIQNTEISFEFDTYNKVKMKLIILLVFMLYLLISPINISFINLILSISLMLIYLIY